jgi:uncharacterized protein YbjT (DUF2867 family)
MITRKILVVCATGKQGGALIEALLASKTSNFDIYGLTRDAASNSAKKLMPRRSPWFKVIQKFPNLFLSKLALEFGVFSLLQCQAKTKRSRPKPLIDASVVNGIQHFVFTSVDRGGPSKSENDPTYVPHFITKYNIEKHLKEKAAGSPQKMAWTILRPVAFLDNLTPDFLGKSFSRIMKQMDPTKINMIGTKTLAG